MTVTPTIETLGSVHEIDQSAWNALAGPDDFYQSHEWLAAIERDKTAEACYLLAFVQDQLVGALPLYHVAFEGSARYRPERFRELLGIEGDYLIAGGRRCYRSAVLVSDRLSPREQDEVTAALVEAARAAAAEAGLAGAVLPYLPTRTLERIGRVLPVTAAYDTAEAVVPDIGGGLEPYLARLSAKRRNTARREMRAFDTAGWRTGTEHLADCVHEVAELAALVEQRHGLATPAMVLSRVFQRQVRAVDHHAVVLTCRDEDGRLAACTVNYAWHNTLFNRTVGIDDTRLRHAYEYFNLLIYRSVEYAAQHGLEHLHLSIDPSRAKLQRGALVRPLWTAAVRTAAPDVTPGIHLTDPAALDRWSDPLRPYAHAFQHDLWRNPASAR